MQTSLGFRHSAQPKQPNLIHNYPAGPITHCSHSFDSPRGIGTAAASGVSGTRHMQAMAPASQQPGPMMGEALPHLQDVGCIYLDYNATTPIWPEVANCMAPYLHLHFGNPSSGHTYGRTCKAAVDQARLQVARLINAQPLDVCFTACGTESDNWAIGGAVMEARQRWGPQSGRMPHIVTSTIEHPAVLVYLQHMHAQGLLIYSEVACDKEGVVDAADVAAAVGPDTVLVTIMHSNNETGAIQPITAISKAVRAKTALHGWEVLIHTDAAQSAGKVQLDVLDLGVDLMTLVGHKLGAPKGVAALWVREGVRISNMLHGGGQEAGRRAGTENVLLLVGLGSAAEVAHTEATATHAHMQTMRDRLQQQLTQAFPAGSIQVNGPLDSERRLPNTLSISIKGMVASQALATLRDRLAASAGAACHSSGAAVSPVLQAMGVTTEFGVGTLRLSTGRHTTKEEVDAAVQLLLGEARAQGVILSRVGMELCKHTPKL